MHDRPPAAALRLGMIESLCKARMPQMVDYVSRLYPQLHITITIDSPSVLLDAMNHNKVDLVYVLDKPLYDTKWVKVFQRRGKYRIRLFHRFPSGLPEGHPLEEVIRQPFS